MLTELELLGEWIPEQMEPGTLFVLENTGTMGEANNPYVAVLACPHCGALGLITKLQYVGMESMIPKTALREEEKRQTKEARSWSGLLFRWCISHGGPQGPVILFGLRTG